jgi:hypothetical protein
MWRGMDTFTEATGMEPSSVPLWSAAAGLLQRRGAEVQLRDGRLRPGSSREGEPKYNFALAMAIKKR